MPKHNLYAQKFPTSAETTDTLIEQMEWIVEHPETMDYDPEADRAEVIGDTFGDLSYDEEKESTTPRIREVNDKIEETVKSQMLYVLRETAKKTGREAQYQAVMQQKKVWTGTAFREVLDSLAQKLGADGKPVVDPETKKPVYEVSESEIDELIRNSSLVEAVGESDPMDLDILAYNRSGKRDDYVKGLYDEIQDATVKETESTEKELDDYFDNAFEGEEYFPDRVKAGRIRMFNDRIAKYKSENREIDESLIAKTWSDIDLALKGYVCPKHDCLYDGKFSEDGKLSPEEYRKLSYGALSSTTAVAQAKRLASSGSYEAVSAACEHLKEIRAQRSGFQKFIDWFKPSGEYRTIQKLQREMKTAEEKNLGADFRTPLQKQEEMLGEKHMISGRRLEELACGAETRLRDAVECALGISEQMDTARANEMGYAQPTAEKTEEKVEAVNNETFREILGESAKLDNEPLETETVAQQNAQTQEKAPVEQGAREENAPEA